MKRLKVRAPLVLIMLTAFADLAVKAQTPTADITSAIVSAVQRRSPSARTELAALYDAVGSRPLWVDETGHPSADAHEALRLLSGAATDALDPADYEAPALAGKAAVLEKAPSPTASSVADFDTGLSEGTLRYLRHLHTGRIDPRAIGFRMTASRDAHDFAELLRSAVAGHRVRHLATELAPPLVLYRNLREMLRRYRDLAADSALARNRVPDRTVRPGDSAADLGSLFELLGRLGDLSASPPVPLSETYDEPLVGAVKRFQQRHGLEADGIVGAATRAALSVPLTDRVRQIELALERLRWLPHLDPERFVAVNIPMFQLWVWDAIPANGAPSFGMNVIVGRSLNRQTPVFVERMDSIVFRPYWNVPSSIVRGEILPAIARDPTYLERHDMEIVSGQGDNARIEPAMADSIAQLQQGRLRVRQRPGPRNSLGTVKFVFPNDANVYLHSTPAPELFRQSRRDFSHGCVRVEDPVALAEWALKSENGWTRDRIVAAMDAPRPLHVKLTRPIQVILFYITAAVMPDDGSIHFAQDIYGHDARLDRALRRSAMAFPATRARSPGPPSTSRRAGDHLRAGLNRWPVPGRNEWIERSPDHVEGDGEQGWTCSSSSREKAGGR
jgi:murein L,D-transpeptidase YcbB/YkuD